MLQIACRAIQPRTWGRLGFALSWTKHVWRQPAPQCRLAHWMLSVRPCGSALLHAADPTSYTDALVIEEVRMRADPVQNYPGRGYRYYVGKPLFEFGTGLSLTTFVTRCRNDSVAGDTHVTCTVTNTGTRTGDEVVLVFQRPPIAAPGQPQVPIRRLLDFERLSDIPPGGDKACKFVVMQSELELPIDAGLDRFYRGHPSAPWKSRA